MDAQWKKGALTMCVLQIVDQSDIHGYAVMKKIQELLPDVYEGTVYTVLRRLCGNGQLKSYTMTNSGKPRRYYKITNDGKKMLTALVTDWRQLLLAVQMLGIE